MARSALAGVLLSLLAGGASAQALTHEKFAAVMNTVFGAGAWRMTGGYRTPEREDELRAQGAMTVRPGGTSRHSLGRPGAPGAYDLVVDGMSPSQAEDRLRNAGAPFARYQPKGAHGTQGPHLHLEPYGFAAPASGPSFQVAAAPPSTKTEGGRQLAVTIAMPMSGPRRLDTSGGEVSRLRASALRNDAGAQLDLGRAYALGYIVPRDFAEARVWLTAAVDNPGADPLTRAVAAAGLEEVAELLTVERSEQRSGYATLKVSAGR